MFPVTDSSQTIIDCFEKAVQNLGIKVYTSQSVQSLFYTGETWKIDTQSNSYQAEKIVLQRVVTLKFGSCYKT